MVREQQFFLPAVAFPLRRLNFHHFCRTDTEHNRFKSHPVTPLTCPFFPCVCVSSFFLLRVLFSSFFSYFVCLSYVTIFLFFLLFCFNSYQFYSLYLPLLATLPFHIFCFTFSSSSLSSFSSSSSFTLLIFTLLHLIHTHYLEEFVEGGAGVADGGEHSGYGDARLVHVEVPVEHQVEGAHLAEGPGADLGLCRRSRW